ncbi:arginase family protein [Actinomadura madurae]|uniref:arginase family protein n=1 Tax=Actinomadura madurae TaxID=1993 RepID=UPI00399A9A19
MDSPGTCNFAGLPYAPDGTAGGERADAAVVGVPPGAGGTSEAPDDGPGAIRRAARPMPAAYDPATDTEIFDRLRVVDAGDLNVPSGGPGAVAERLARIRANAALLAVLGGGPAASAPAAAAAAGAAGRPLTLVRLAASAGLATGDPATGAVRWMIERDHLARVFQIGLRGFGATRADLRWGAGTGAEYWSMADMEEMGAAPFLDRIVSVVSTPVYLSVDLDVLDPAFAPAVAVPEPGGLTTREVLGVVRMLARHVDLAGLDIVGLVPGRDTGGATALVAARLLTEVLAGRAAGISPGAVPAPA